MTSSSASASSTNVASERDLEFLSARFATLTPDNARAAAALLAVVESPPRGFPLQHQRKFIELVRTAVGSVVSPSSSFQSPSGDVSEEDHNEGEDKEGIYSLPSGGEEEGASAEQRPRQDGDAKFYRFVLDLDQLPSGPGGNWQIGKALGKKPEQPGVDLLLCNPRDLTNRDIGRVVALISIHPESGAFMIQAASSRCPVTYLSGDGNSDIRLAAGEKTVLHMTRNRLRIGRTPLDPLDYVLELGVADESRFLLVRDEFLRSFVSPEYGSNMWMEPHRQLDSLPKQSHHRVRSVVIHRTISSGAFGIVKSGIHARTGRAVAIKTIHCKARDVRSVKNEIQIATSFDKDCVGIVPVLDTWCEHGESPPCFAQHLEDVYISMPLARDSFYDMDWSQIDDQRRLSLFHQTLQGLQHIHGRGFMHRDISPKNLLIFSAASEPPKAGICDFGKAIEAAHSCETGIGPIHTVAPEVWAAGLNPEKPYTQTIDIWSLVYTWLFTFQRPADLRENPKTDARRNDALLATVSRLGAAGRMPPLLGDLMCAMLAFSPEGRPTAGRALEHAVWDAIRGNEVEEKGKAVEGLSRQDSPDVGLRTPSPAPRPAKKARLRSDVERMIGDPPPGPRIVSESLPDTEPFA